MASVNPHDLPPTAHSAVLCVLKDMIGAFQDWTLKGRPDSFHDWSSHLASIDELALEFDLQSHIPVEFNNDAYVVANMPSHGLQADAGVQRANFSEAQRLAGRAEPIAPPTDLTLNTTYKAIGPTKSSIKVTAPQLPLELHQMIVWAMHHPQEATYLLPEYRQIRQQASERDEAQQTYCGQDI